MRKWQVLVKPGVIASRSLGIRKIDSAKIREVKGGRS